ncbi:SsrA-binding protein SmpB [Entomospira culicis]|uniref:SsrA-binding protein n=1 Tax=Entomospira culicis TaxID=2719989 RepID=A0A968GGN5_9SPIO|nr:SsrA-binding protein SmpB [Entomospira culicis]NIZ19362.1 SsrA-binding protein SmpB [Entomospira culicis]NIZ69733.1 SsrA-binding protein SmpB [Entomospira culicis]WDI36844.1 SsrA-binding protein SmpB [Entomospira culicis]WDI38473.1 SsrA-binding protein SmpB [Entomospira culicis]
MKKNAKKPAGVIADNRKARFNYEIIQELECGIALVGTEVKSLRDGHMSFVDSYCEITESEQLYIYKLNISPYTHGNIYNHLTDRPRRLLAHKKEIQSMYRKVREKGITLVPLKFYFKNNRVKVLVGLARGKKLYDKRETIKERDTERNIARDFKLKV